MSKRKLLQLVTEGHVSGWDDPRLPTISGIRCRRCLCGVGVESSRFLPESISIRPVVAARIGISPDRIASNNSFAGFTRVSMSSRPPETGGDTKGNDRAIGKRYAMSLPRYPWIRPVDVLAAQHFPILGHGGFNRVAESHAWHDTSRWFAGYPLQSRLAP